MRILELFCGIGGMAAAFGDRAEVAAAFDLDRVGLGVYAANFPTHRTVVRNLDTLPAADLAAYQADAWTLSPPCQPYTRRGKGRDLDDRRARSLRNLVGRLAEVRPAGLFVENVPGFATSRAADLLRETLDGCGYEWRETILCPSELGWPNRRRRFYLVAGGLLRGERPAGTRPAATTDSVNAQGQDERIAVPATVREGTGPSPTTSRWTDRVGEGPVPSREPSERQRPSGARPAASTVGECVERRYDDDPELAVPADLQKRYPHALSVVDATDPAAVTACFTSAYGRSPVRSGSYVRLADGRLRRFHPREVLALLGFPAGYRLPPDLPLANAWRLAGNSLSLPAVRHALAAH